MGFDRVEDYNLFMMCEKPERSAFRPLPEGYSLRFCEKDELEVWMRFPFDTKEEGDAYLGMMEDYFRQVYQPKGDLFFRSCLFLCSPEEVPVGTCFLWKAYDAVWTLHWLKVRKEEEDKGLGRALLSHVLGQLPEAEYPVFLHTQPGSYRAIKLYSDFGFRLLLAPEKIGYRENQLEASMAYLRQQMTPEAFEGLRFAEAPAALLKAAAGREQSEF